MACMDVCPLASELSVINSNILCPEEGCGKVFRASSALNMHLTKHHRNSCLVKKDTSVTVRYFCPEEKCVYHVNASRHFTQMKYLKQHYIKVHSEKKFNCQACSKAFATQELLRYHLQVCGIQFTCSCGNTYRSYEALLTHSKRKHHTFDEKFKTGSKRSKTDAIGDISPAKDTSSLNVDMMQPVYILPKPITDPLSHGMSVNIISTPNLTDVSAKTLLLDKSMQTDPIEPKRKKTIISTKVIEKSLKCQASAQTQTSGSIGNQQPKKTAETQTMGDYILIKAMEDADIFCNEGQSSPQVLAPARKRKNNSGTQTGGRKCSRVSSKANEPILEQSLDAMSLSSCPAFCLKKDVGLPDLWVADKITSSTQTAIGTDDSLLHTESFSCNMQLSNEINLDLFSQDGSLCSSSNLRSIFEDNSNSFDNIVGTSANYDPVSHADQQVHSLESLSGENFGSCIAVQTDQNLNNIFTPCEDESASFSMRANTETQTTDDLADFDSLLYTNMWTQTSEETLFSGLDFADIQTQTAWPLYGKDHAESVLVSTETQTPTSNNTFDAYSSILDNGCWSCGPSHIETQTCEEDLRDLMAELDSV